MADAYTVLARRYRSQTFDQLVGQEAVAQTLKNAIRTNRVAHAFLFTGTRGVGKTSAARILAKAINCLNRSVDGDPCGVCESCKAIARGEDMDVIEIDGASNNGVDNIRDLRQAAGIRPARSPYKIYIIDEVHMVTTNAFNALLKTLEEPPEHVKFIFATTEVGKVPATILSRCQRFDFKPIPLPRIAEHLTAIIKDEKMKADTDAIFRIARLGNGSMRDALSILDRVLSMGEKQITDKVLEDLLGRPPTQAIGALVEAIANGDAGAAIKLADRLLQEGMGVEQVLSELVEFLRNLMIVATCGDKTELLEVPAESRERYTSLSGKFDPPTLVHLMALAEQTLRSLKSSTMQRPLFDALIVRLALSEQFTEIRRILSSDSSQAPANPQTAGQKKSDIARVERRGSADGAPEAVCEAEALSAGDGQAVKDIPPPAVPPDDAPADNIEVVEENIYEVMKGHIQRQKDETEARNAQLRQQGRTTGRPGPRAGAGDVATPREAPPDKVSDLNDLSALWTATRAWLAGSVRYLESVLGECGRIESLDPQSGQAVLILPASQEGFANEKARSKIEEALRGVTGLAVRLAFKFVEESPEAGAQAERSRSGVQGPGQASGRVPAEVSAAVLQQPVVQELMKKLDARLVSIELLGTADEE